MKEGDTAINVDQNPYYGTFHGVANHYHPPPHPVVTFPQPAPPPGYYQSHTTIVSGYPVVHEDVFSERRLPCCGLGVGWFLFLMGFFFGGLPWYFGALVMIVSGVDRREKPGYVACAIASILALFAYSFGLSKASDAW